MSAFATDIKRAQEIVGRKIMDKLQRNPRAWGKVTVEVTIQDGKIKTVSSTDNETEKVPE